MTKKAVIRELEKQHLKKDIPKFNVGDTVRVHLRIIEGEKERIQVFMGTVIAKKGTGMAETFSVHRVAYGVGMERVFLLHSPRVAKIEVVKEGVVRRAKLYYLRGKTGKSARVKSRLGGPRKQKAETNGEAAPVEAEEAVAEEVIDQEVVETSAVNEKVNIDSEPAAANDNAEAEIQSEEEKADA